MLWRVCISVQQVGSDLAHAQAVVHWGLLGAGAQEGKGQRAANSSKHSFAFGILDERNSGRTGFRGNRWLHRAPGAGWCAWHIPGGAAAHANMRQSQLPPAGQSLTCNWLSGHCLASSCMCTPDNTLLGWARRHSSPLLVCGAC
jgi:hypothetical protein